MLPGEDIKFTCYSVTRIVISVLDIVTDTIQGSSMFALHYPIWGVLTLTFPLLGIVSASAAILVETFRNRNHQPVEPPLKIIAKILIALTTLYEGLVESGPEMIVQLIILLRGIHTDDFMVLFNSEDVTLTWSFYSALVHLLSIVASFLSIVFTMMYFNEQEFKYPKKLFLALVSNVICIFYRIYMATLMFCLSPLVALGSACIVYSINSIMFFFAGKTKYMSFVSGYATLFSPFGCSKSHILGHNILLEVSIEERTRIELHRDLRLAKRSHSMFALTSLLILLPYSIIVEMTDNLVEDIVFIDLLGTNPKLFLYLIPILGLLLTWLSSAAYVAYMKRHCTHLLFQAALTVPVHEVVALTKIKEQKNVEK